MAYAGSNFTNTMQRPGGGRQALRNLRAGSGQQGRNAMSRYTGPNARPPGQQQGRGRQNIRSMLSQRPNQNAYDNANPNARFNRPTARMGMPQYAGPAIGGGSDINSPRPNPPGPTPTLLGGGPIQTTQPPVPIPDWQPPVQPAPEWMTSPGGPPIERPEYQPAPAGPPGNMTPGGDFIDTRPPSERGGSPGELLNPPPSVGPGPMTYTPGGGISHEPVDPSRGGPMPPPPAGNPYTDKPLPPAPLPQRGPPSWANAQGGYRSSNPNDNPNARFNRGGGRERIRQLMQQQLAGRGGPAPVQQPTGNPGLDWMIPGYNQRQTQGTGNPGLDWMIPGYNQRG